MNAQPDAPLELLVEVRSVHVRFGRQQVLRDVNLRITRGQTVAIIGESGCGKTVLLKTIVGLIRPDQGEAWFAGKNLGTLSEQELAAMRVRTGFVFQGAALFDSMTIGQNVAFPLHQHTNKPEQEINETVLELLAEVGLPEAVLHKRPAELSGGMRKRVGLARALAMNPELMLYDEPTTGLDPIMSDVINELVLSVRKRLPVTSVLVTHDMQTARKVADRVVMLYPTSRLRPDEAQIVFDGPPAAIERSSDPRVTQFVRGEAGERIMELRKAGEPAVSGNRDLAQAMDEQNKRFRVGVTVLGALLILGILMMLFGNLPSLVRGVYRIHVKFTEAPGVAPDTPVRKSGIRIGRVSKVEFDEQGDGVIVSLVIDSGVKIPRSDSCRVSGSLLGDATVQFVASGRPRDRKDLITDMGETIRGDVSSSPFDTIGNLEGDLQQAIKSVGHAGSEVGKLAETVNRFFADNDGKVENLVDETTASLKSLREAFNNVNSILGDEQVKDDLRQAFAELPGVLSQTKAAITDLQKTVNLAGDNLRNLKGFTGPLGEKGLEVVDKIDRSVGRLDELLSNFSQFSRSLNDNSGTLGQLVKSPELYDRVNRAAANIEQLTRELKPIVRDARLFAGKIAAHPEVLGVRGAIKPSTGIK